MIGTASTVIKLSRKAAQQSMLQDQSEAVTTKATSTLLQASSELLSRLNTASQAAEQSTADLIQSRQATIYRYRSRAKITHYNLPLLAVNE